MNSREVATYCSVTTSRVGTISRALFGEVPNDYTDVLVNKVNAVAEHMKSSKIRSVKTAIADMNSNQAQQTAQSQPQSMGGDMLSAFGEVVEAASDQTSDQLTAAVILKTMEKFGKTGGPRSQQAMELFTQTLIPDDQQMANVGLALPSSSNLLLSASTAE